MSCSFYFFAFLCRTFPFFFRFFFLWLGLSAYVSVCLSVCLSVSLSIPLFPYPSYSIPQRHTRSLSVSLLRTHSLSLSLSLSLSISLCFSCLKKNCLGRYDLNYTRFCCHFHFRVKVVSKFWPSQWTVEDFLQYQAVDSLTPRMLEENIENLPDHRFTEASNSPYGAPVFFVKKADGSMRLVCDRRALKAGPP